MLDQAVCSDLKVEGIVQSLKDRGRFGASLSKFGVQYKGWIDFEGRMVIASEGRSKEFTVLAQDDIDAMLQDSQNNL